jgi:TRAP-type mannitol/chloroaromatic compound transport system permease small subunit
LEQTLLFIDRLSAGVGKAFSWCIVVLTFGVGYEVFVRKVLSAPTDWAFDVSYMMYGALFMMSGAYTLSRNGHVRGDMFYRMMAPRGQAMMDLVLYLLFFFPAFGTLLYFGIPYAQQSYSYKEVSVFSPAGIPIYPTKALIPVAAAFMLIQGVAEVIRCIITIRQNQWPQRLHDVEEMDAMILHEAEDRRKLEEEAAAKGSVTP